MKNQETLITLLYIAGAGQIGIALVYDWVRKILGWDEDLARLKHRWNQQIAHTYSRYIQGLNFTFGLITLLFAPAFFEGNAIATALAGLIAVYWAIRLLIAIGFYEARPVTEGHVLYQVGGIGFNALFGYLAVIYGLVVVVAL